MFRTKFVKEIKTHVFCSIIFFKRAFYEIMWKNIVEPGRPQMTMKYGAYVLHVGCLRLQTTLRICNTAFARNNGFTNSPQCYFICTLLVLCHVCARECVQAHACARPFFNNV